MTTARHPAAVLILLGACGSRAAPSQGEAAPPSATDAAIAFVSDSARVVDAAPSPDPCALVNSADLAETCGIEGSLTTDPDEGQPGHPSCMRWVGESTSYARFGFSMNRTDAASVASNFEENTEAAERVEIVDVALGERARIKKDTRAKNTSTITLHVIRGDAYLILKQTRRNWTICTDEQLVELARRALGRLP